MAVGAGPDRIVIVGASLAGGTAAVALRDQGFDGALIIIGEESQRPYERPPLSKALLQGVVDEPDWVGDENFWRDRVDWRSATTVTQLRVDDHVVVAGGEEIGYDKLLLATGSASARLEIAGAELDGVVTLRTLDEALALRERLTSGTRVVVVGGGWIGCEVAATASQRGAEVTLIVRGAAPLDGVVGVQLGEVFTALHRDHGVDVRIGAEVVGFGGDGSVSEVLLAGGGTVPAELVVAAVGATPNVALADQAGLDLAGGGVAVDATLRTSDPDVYAVGDIAAQAHPAYPNRVRVEHWACAHDQGEHVAQNLLGADVAYEKRPFFFSDQYDLGLEYRGLADPAHDELVIRGDLEQREFVAFWLHDGVVAATLNVNAWDDTETLQQLVDTGASATAAELTDGDLSRLL